MTSQDEDQLRLLAIYHYVLAVFAIGVLMRDSVKRLFSAGPVAGAAAGLPVI